MKKQLRRPKRMPPLPFPYGQRATKWGYYDASGKYVGKDQCTLTRAMFTFIDPSAFEGVKI